MRLLILLLILIPSLGFSQTNKKKNKEKQIQAYFDYKVFQIPNENSSYIECYLEFVGIKINYQSVNGKDLQGQIALSYELKRGDSIYASNAYKMNTPVMRDSIVDNFYEVFRVQAPKAGAYELSISLLDVNSDNDFVTTRQLVEVPEIKNTPYISYPIIAESIRNAGESEDSRFEKNGLIVFPRIKNLFETHDVNMPFYLEIYNIDSAKTYLLKWSIENDITKENLIAFNGAKKLGKSKNQVVRENINIDNLPTGEYNLIFTLSEGNKNTLSTKKYFFAKQTDVLDDFKISDVEDIIIDPAFQASIPKDSLKYYLNSLRPLVGNSEQTHIAKLSKDNNEENIRKYFERFWIAMSKAPAIEKKKPYDLWLAYKGQVRLVQQKFRGSNMPGYMTDRGRVYLQYGSPSSIIVQETSPSEYPYEIWHYDKIKEYSNRTFVFYSPRLVQTEYELLHSDMIGELHNYRWQHDLNKRTSPIKDIDDPNDGNIDHFGGNSSIYYNQH